MMMLGFELKTLSQYRKVHMTSLKANEILNKFWIIEDKDTKEKVGTLSKDTDNRYMVLKMVLVL